MPIDLIKCEARLDLVHADLHLLERLATDNPKTNSWRSASTSRP